MPVGGDRVKVVEMNGIRGRGGGGGGGGGEEGV